MQSQPVALHASKSLIQPVCRVVRERAGSNEDDPVALLPPVTRVVGNQEVQSRSDGEPIEIDTLDEGCRVAVFER